MNIIVYTRDNCLACEKWKQIIRKICDVMGLKLTIEDITNNEEAKEQLRFVGIKSVPVTIINEGQEKIIKEGCFSENYFKTYLNNLNLDGNWCEWQ